jgi:hypothetical protein
MRSFGVTLLVVLIPSATALRGAKQRSLEETSNIFLFSDGSLFPNGILPSSDSAKKKGKTQKRDQKSEPTIAELINNDSNLITGSELPTMSPTECDDGPDCPTSISSLTSNYTQSLTSNYTQSLTSNYNVSLAINYNVSLPIHYNVSLPIHYNGSLARNYTQSPIDSETIDPECDDGPGCPTSSQSLVGNSSLMVSDDQHVNANFASMIQNGDTENDEYIKVTMGVKDASSSAGWGAGSLFTVGIVFAATLVI